MEETKCGKCGKSFSAPTIEEAEELKKKHAKVDHNM